MPTDERQKTQSKAAGNDRQIHEKSEELITFSNALLQEARDLCTYSRRLRAINKFLAVINANPNAALKRKPHWKAALQFASRPQTNFSIDVSLRRSEPSSKEPQLKVLDQSKILY